MRLKLLLLASIAACGSALAANLPADVFLRDRTVGRQPTLPRLSTDLLLGRKGAAERLERALLTKGLGRDDDRLNSFLLLCGAYFREQQYALGLKACLSAEEMKKASAGNMVHLHRAFASVGPTRWTHQAVRIPLENGQITQARARAGAIRTLIDTGAEIGVVSQSAVSRLRARPLQSSVKIGTTTTPVAGGIVAIDSVGLGNAELRNLAAVVIPDDVAATIGADLVIPFPALLAAGRLAYLDHGRTLALGRAAPGLSARRTPLYWDESGIGFAARFAGGIRAVHFDSGSERIYLFPTAAHALSPAERATRVPRRRKITGLGGERVEQASLYRHVTIGIAGSQWRFPEIEMAQKDENGEAARIGIGLFRRFATVVLDFQRMQMSVAER